MSPRVPALTLEQRRLRAPGRGLIALAFGILVVAGCSLLGRPDAGTQSPSIPPTPSVTPGPPLTAPQLKLTLIHRFGSLWYCDPDFYPIARGEEIDHAREQWADLTADRDAFQTILADQGLTSGTTFTDEQTLSIYRAWKVLRAIALDSIGNGRFRFDYLAGPAAGAAEGTRTAGTISETGEVAIDQQVPAPEPICPICLARGTPIDAPGGAVAVDRLRIGDTIWTLDAAGRRVPGRVLALGSTPAPAGHHVVHLGLADGRAIVASPGHPLADGRAIGDLRVGDRLDGSRVIEATLLPYGADATFDLVVSGPTGVYLAGGIPLHSTLTPSLTLPLD